MWAYVLFSFLGSGFAAVSWDHDSLTLFCAVKISNQRGSQSVVVLKRKVLDTEDLALSFRAHHGYYIPDKLEEFGPTFLWVRFPVAIGLAESLYECCEGELSYLVLLGHIFKSLFLVAHRFPGCISNDAGKSFLPPQEDLISAVCFVENLLNVHVQ